MDSSFARLPPALSLIEPVSHIAVLPAHAINLTCRCGAFGCGRCGCCARLRTRGSAQSSRRSTSPERYRPRPLCPADRSLVRTQVPRSTAESVLLRASAGACGRCALARSAHRGPEGSPQKSPSHRTHVTTAAVGSKQTAPPAAYTERSPAAAAAHSYSARRRSSRSSIGCCC
jgi:hypothetical protein